MFGILWQHFDLAVGNVRKNNENYAMKTYI